MGAFATDKLDMGRVDIDPAPVESRDGGVSGASGIGCGWGDASLWSLRWLVRRMRRRFAGGSLSMGEGGRPSCAGRRVFVSAIGDARNGRDGPVDDVCPDLEQTPKAPRRQGIRSGSPPKRQRTLNEIFHTVEKPIQTKSLKSGRSLPSDVSALYRQIHTTGLMVGILPHALRSVGTFSQLPDIQFRTPEQDQDLGITDGLKLHLAVRKIVRASLESENVKRLESGWNFLVHAPVLNLVFESEPLLDEEDEDYDEALESQVPPVTARWEAIMGATITAEAKPAPQSASVGSASTRSASSDLGSLYNRSDSKKVDFAVLLQINPREQGLRQAIAEAGFVNQTVSQLNLLDNPIAVSIETKGSEGSGDAIAQLGIWTAAWHKRMLALRQFRFPPIPRAYLPPAQPGNAQPPGSLVSPVPRRLVTVLLIKVVAHDWFLYFSCDRGNFIEILGPLKLGSTVSVQDTYVLLTSLGHIRKWVETTFFDGIRSWFMDE